jgi:hypothetical protein
MFIGVVSPTNIRSAPMAVGQGHMALMFIGEPMNILFIGIGSPMNIF